MPAGYVNNNDNDDNDEDVDSTDFTTTWNTYLISFFQSGNWGPRDRGSNVKGWEKPRLLTLK